MLELGRKPAHSMFQDITDMSWKSCVTRRCWAKPKVVQACIRKLREHKQMPKYFIIYPSVYTHHITYIDKSFSRFGIGSHVAWFFAGQCTILYRASWPWQLPQWSYAWRCFVLLCHKKNKWTSHFPSMFVPQVLYFFDLEYECFGIMILLQLGPSCWNIFCW